MQQQQEWALGRSQAIQMRAPTLLGQIHCNALWGPHPSATLSCRSLARFGRSARHLPLLSRSVAVSRGPILDVSPPSARTRTAPGTPEPAWDQTHSCQRLLHCDSSAPATRRPLDVLRAQQTKQPSCSSCACAGRSSASTADPEPPKDSIPAAEWKRIWKSPTGPCLFRHVRGKDAPAPQLRVVAAIAKPPTAVNAAPSTPDVCCVLQPSKVADCDCDFLLEIPHSAHGAGVEGPARMRSSRALQQPGFLSKVQIIDITHPTA